MREIAAPYLKSGEEILAIGYGWHKGFWKSTPYILSLTKERFLLIQSGGWHTHYKVKDVSEIPLGEILLDPGFLPYVKKGPSWVTTRQTYNAAQDSMNTLYLSMPDGSKQFFTFPGKDNKETPATMVKIVVEMIGKAIK